MRNGTLKFGWILAVVAAGAACSASAVAGEVPPLYVVEVTAPSREALAPLLEMPYIISNVQGSTATLYLSPADYEHVCALGFKTRLVEVQPGQAAEPEKSTGYITYDEIGPLLAGYESTYPDLCRSGTLGQSVGGRELWTIKITEHPDQPADKPVVKFVSSLHGDEPVGMQLCLYFAEDLLSGYESNAYIRDLLARTVIWLVPMANPDGYVNYTRVNANGWDLNRSFPIYSIDYLETWYDTGVLGDEGYQPEVALLMQWHAAVPGALSANFHGGALVANYPYDNDPGIPSGVEAPSPDDDVFRYVSLQYSSNNTPMYNSPEFPQGIVNGSRWYSITGGMMDWNYRCLGCPEVTFEVSNIKRPNASSLPQLWLDNRDAMFAYVETAHIGIRGLILDRNTGESVWAKVRVSDRTQPVFSSPEIGNYHRLLLPGVYNLAFEASSYITYYRDSVSVSEGPASRVNVTLSNGDLNYDGGIDNLDVQCVVDAVLGRTVTFDADVDGRGLSASDIQAVINQT